MNGSSAACRSVLIVDFISGHGFGCKLKVDSGASMGAKTH
jgi:hypothetical protein